MEEIKDIKETKTPRDLAVLNMYSENYRELNIEFIYRSKEREEYMKTWNYDIEHESIKKKIQEDFDIMQEIKSNKMNLRNAPTVGDYILIDGKLHRLCIYLYDNEFQVGNLFGSYHISRDGYTSYSGGCDERIDVSHAKLSSTAPARFWMWHHDYVGANRGININIPVKVWSI